MGPLLKWGGFLAASGLGCLIVFLNRFAPGADQISYLDFAGNLAHGSWFSHINGYWGPLLPALIALAFRWVHPSMALEMPVADAVLAFTFVFVLAAQLFFQARLAGLLEARFPQAWTGDKAAALSLYGFAAVFSSTCGLAGMGILADLLLAGFFLIACGCLAGFLHRPASVASVAEFALVLALGYLAKSVFFLLGWVFIVCFYLGQRDRPRRLFHALLLAVLFVGFSAVQWLPLSLQKGRLTFGDTGRINYIWVLAQGKYAVSEGLQTSLDDAPLKHPFQILSREPLIYGFQGPVGGTVPNWYDPSYYMDGLHLAVRPVRQAVVVFLNLVVLAGILTKEASILPGLPDGTLGVFPALLVFAAFFLLVRHRGWNFRLGSWELLAPAVAGLLLYLLTFMSARYVVAFLLVLMIAGVGWLLAEVSPGREEIMRRLALIFFLLVLGGVFAQALEALHQERRIAGLRGLLRDPDVATAQALRELGVGEGTPVAEIDDLAGVYFPHLARVRILARVDSGPGFWKMSELERQGVYRALAAAGMRDILAAAPPPADSTQGWIPIGESRYLLHRLPAPGAGWREVRSIPAN